jgi:hypothetical protein
MWSDVEVTFGFSRWIVLTGTPLFDEITPKVSPARTVQNRRPAGLALAVVVRAFAAVVVRPCLRGAVGTETGVRAGVRPASSPDRTSRIAIVAASRNAAGATYRFHPRRRATSRTRSRSPA